MYKYTSVQNNIITNLSLFYNFLITRKVTFKKLSFR